MAVVKANYVKRGRGEKGRAKASLRYITHRRDRDGNRVTRALFGHDGQLTKEQAYRLIDGAGRGTFFYRLVLSPDPKREDRFRDLELSEITLHTLLALEERLGTQVPFIATLHDDHTPHRHVHVIALVQGRKLWRADFAALRREATGHARIQRRLRDLVRGRRLSRSRSHAGYNRRHTARSRRALMARPSQAYTCFVCGAHRVRPAAAQGYRCPACGLRMRRDRNTGLSLTGRREGRGGLVRGLSP